MTTTDTTPASCPARGPHVAVPWDVPGARTRVQVVRARECRIVP
jgi:hypothetical protein